MKSDNRIYIAGHNGLAGSAIHRRLKHCTSLILRSRSELDLRDQRAVNLFFEQEGPEYVFLAAGKVGGILANRDFPADFIRDNLLIETNIIDAARRSGVKKLAFLGSSCIYPKMAAQPIKEEYLLTGELEPTNDAYAIAKIAGIKMVESYRRQYGFNAIALMPTSLYGPGDNFDLNSSHVLPALIRKFHDAVSSKTPEVVVWGSGTPRREFMHADDFASAAVHLMQHYDSPEIVNIGTGVDITIADLADLIKSITGYQGQIVYDRSKPDGMERKLLDISRLQSLGWQPSIQLDEGLKSTYNWYVAQTVSSA